MTANGRFDGKVALVTGAASGIGRATALRLAGEGARVLAHDVNADGLAQLATEAPADAVEVRTGDLGDPGECRAAVADCVDRLGRLDVLANIAGIARADYFPDVDEATYRKLFAVNVDGPFFLAQAAIPHLLESHGNIVNIASNAGLMGCAYTVVYCMTKGAVVQLTRALALEYLKHPIRVNAVAPGGTQTALVEGYQLPKKPDYELLARYMVPRPMSDPADIAALVAFVASDEAASIHGAILSADNGLTAG